MEMDYENLFSVEILNKETGEIGLVPSLSMLSLPKSRQIAELESCLCIYAEELMNKNKPENRKIIFESGKGQEMHLKSGEVELVMVVIRKYIKNLREGRI